LGQPSVAENRPGASGAIATERVAQSLADGYTLLAPTAADIVIPARTHTTGYKPPADTRKRSTFECLLLASVMKMEPWRQ
jgi:tripartite-type tricarboxylate transporter receptor subunit TctC